MPDDLQVVARLKFEDDKKGLGVLKRYDKALASLQKKATVKIKVDSGGASGLAGFDRIGKKLAAAQKKGTLKVKADVGGALRSLGRVDKYLDRLKRKAADIKVDTGGRGAGGARLGGGLSGALAGLASKGGRASSAIVGLAGNLAGIAGPAGAAVAAIGLVAASFIGVSGAAVAAGDKVLSWEKMLEFATGSQEAARREMEFASGVADRLGVDVQGLTESYAQFAGAAKGSAFEGEGARHIFEQTTRAMATMGASGEKTQRVLTALTQVMGKGKLQAEEYRQQIGEASPLAMQAFIKASGLTRGEFEKQMSLGNVLAEDILPKYAKALEEMLGDAEPAKTATRSFQRVKNAVFDLAATYGAELSPVVAEILDHLADLLVESKPLVEFWGGETVSAIKKVLEIGQKLHQLYGSLPDSIAPTLKSTLAFTAALEDLGGLSGAWTIMSSGARTAAADILDFFNKVKKSVGNMIAVILDDASMLFGAFKDAPLLGGMADKMSGGLKTASDAIRIMTKESGDLSDAVVKGLRKDAVRALDELAATTTQTSSKMAQGFEKAGDAAGDMADKADEAAEKAKKALLASISTPQAEANAKIEEARKLYEKGDITLQQMIRTLAKYGNVVKSTPKYKFAEIEPVKFFKGVKDFAKDIKKVQGVDLAKVFHGAADAAWTIADAVAAVDENLASAIGGAGALFDQFSSLQQMQDAGAGKGQMAMAGAAMGGQVGGMGRSLGLWQGQRGTSSFGGEMSGDYGELGASVGGALGTMFGPVGTIVGSILGGVIGGAIKSGADEGLAQLRQVGNDVETTITKSEGGLGSVVAGIGESINETIGNIEAILGSEIILGGVGGIIGGEGLAGAGVSLAIKIRDNAIAVFVNGMRREFAETSDAVAFAVGELISSSKIEGVSDFMTQALRGLRVDDVEELQSTLERLMEVDLALSGEVVTETGEAFRQLRVDAAGVRTALRETGAPMASYIAWENKRITTILDGVDAMRQSIIGGEDLAGPLQSLQDEFLASLDIIEKAAAGREREAAALLAYAEQQEANAAAAQEGASSLRDMGKGMGRLAGEIDSAAGAATRSAASAGQARQSYEDFIASMDDIPDAIDVEGIAEAINVGAAKGVQSITGAIISAIDAGLIDIDAEGQADLQRQLFEMDKVIRAAQLGAASAQIEAMLLLEHVSGSTRDALRGLLAEMPGWIDQVIGAELPAGGARGGGGGGGRRRRQREEQEREAEKAAKTLGDFSAELERVRLNASTASGTLGDFAASLQEIRDNAEEALAAGASPQQVARLERLQLRESREDIVSPFRDFGREGYRADSVDIEQARRDAIARAQLQAEAEAEAFGIPFEVAFSRIEDEINAGADRMQRDLVRGVVDAFGLPMENARKEGREFSRMMKELNQAYAAGEIGGARYRDLIEQIQDAQEQSLGGDVLGLLDKYYVEVEGREEFRLQQEQALFELELGRARVTFERLKAEEALSEAAIARIGGFLDFMDANPPDWDKFLSLPDAAGTFAGARSVGGAVGGAGAAGTTGLSALLDSIRGFIRDANAIDFGPFQQMAQDFLGSIEGFQDDLDQELGTMLGGASVEQLAEKVVDIVFGPAVSLHDLTTEQLEQLAEMDLSHIPYFKEGMEDLWDVLLELEGAEGLKPQAIENILDAYRGTQDATDGLVGDFEAIVGQFEDVRDALTMMGASAEDFADAEAIHLQQLEEFYADAVSGIRGLAAEIRGGAFGGVSVREQVDQARQRFEELRARAESGDLEAVEQLEQAMRDLLAAELEFTGGYGPEFDLIREQLLAFGEAFNIPTDGAAAPMQTSDPEMLAKADIHIQVAEETHATIQRGQDLAEATNREILSQLVTLNASLAGGFVPAAEGAGL